jgi:hypothetical protein
MRTFIMIAVAAGAASIAAAQEFPSLRDNPIIFQQPNEPPWPKPVPPPGPAIVIEQPAPAPPPPQENERENVVGHEETDLHQRLYDQWNAPGQSRGGTAIVIIVE